MQTSKPEVLSIQLNNCIRRIDAKANLVELVAQQGCHLKRIRRSSHWLLQGELNKLIELSELLKQTPI